MITFNHYNKFIAAASIIFKYQNMSITSSTMGKRTFKIVLLGDSSTGKTSIIDRFVNNKFEEKDNVHPSLSSPQSELISLVRTLRITVLPAGYNFGTLQVNRDIEASSQVI